MRLTYKALLGAQGKPRAGVDARPKLRAQQRLMLQQRHAASSRKQRSKRRDVPARHHHPAYDGRSEARGPARQAACKQAQAHGAAPPASPAARCLPPRAAAVACSTGPHAPRAGPLKRHGPRPRLARAASVRAKRQEQLAGLPPRCSNSGAWSRPYALRAPAAAAAAPPALTGGAEEAAGEGKPGKVGKEKWKT